MVQHLTRRSMDEFTQTVVAGNSWDSFDVDVGLSCLPEQPLHLNIRRYIPSCDLFALQTHANSANVDIRYSLPVGIYGADPKAMVQNFNTYLENIIDNHLIKYSSLLLQVSTCDYSSRTVRVLFSWFQEWKEEVS